MIAKKNLILPYSPSTPNIREFLGLLKEKSPKRAEFFQSSHEEMERIKAEIVQFCEEIIAPDFTGDNPFLVPIDVISTNFSSLEYIVLDKTWYVDGLCYNGDRTPGFLMKNGINGRIPPLYRSLYRNGKPLGNVFCLEIDIPINSELYPLAKKHGEMTEDCLAISDFYKINGDTFFFNILEGEDEKLIRAIYKEETERINLFINNWFADVYKNS